MITATPSCVLLTNATIATLADDQSYGLVKDGAILIKDGLIEWVGPTASYYASMHESEEISMQGRLVTPGLIDCHTHAVYAGSRAGEFEMRLNGASYEQIAKAGGGIFSTVKATRAASEGELFDAAVKRIDDMIACGVTTVEIKSGYGLDLETERNMLRAARRIGEARDIEVKTTFLGAHAIPKGMKADAYIDGVCLPALDQLVSEGLVDAVDGFCEGIAFTPAQIERVFERAQQLGLAVKLHAEQLSALGGGSLAAQYKALSADHLEYATEDDIKAMAQAGTIAVILPGAFYFLKETKKPPIDLFRKHGVEMAVATDHNPGSSPMTSLPLTMNMAATFFGMTPEENLRGTTINAARALGLKNVGRIAKGYRADLAVWDVQEPAELTYRIGNAPLYKRIFGGKLC